MNHEFISNLAILKSLYSLTLYKILFPLDIMNRHMLEQRWDILCSRIRKLWLRSIWENPLSSIRRHRSQELDISRSSSHRILRKHLGMTSCKVKLVQELKAYDHPLCFRFVGWNNEKLYDDVDFIKRKKTKLFFILVGTLISKTAVFGA